jgi:hypothetical protein
MGIQRPCTAFPILIYGGVISVECQGVYFGIGFAKLWVGNLHPYHYAGASGPANTGPSYSGGGWAYKDGSSTNGSSYGGTGNSSGWGAVLDRWANEGECTPGWVLFVDNVMVCDGS